MLIILLCAFLVQAAGAQEVQSEPQTVEKYDNPVLLLGLSVEDLIYHFGAPVSVYPIRGVEAWQDDVVFVYKAADFYLFKDHVWQVGLKQVNGIKVGDAKMTVTMVHGSAAEDKGSYLVAGVPAGGWRIEYRYNVDEKGKISAIYVYRPDY